MSALWASFALTPTLAAGVAVVDFGVAVAVGLLVGVLLRRLAFLRRWWVELPLIFGLSFFGGNVLALAGGLVLGAFAGFPHLDPASPSLVVASLLAVSAANLAIVVAIGMAGSLQPGGRPAARWWGLAPVLAAACLAVSFVWGAALDAVGVTPEPQWVVQALLDAPTWVSVGVALFVAGWAPVVEELVFRGWLQPRLREPFGPRLAILAQAAVFAAMHLDRLWAIPPLFVIGAVAGWLRQRSESVAPGVVLHFCNNAASLAITVWFAARG